jgi:hypothetical protein
MCIGWATPDEGSEDEQDGSEKEKHQKQECFAFVDVKAHDQ